MFIPVRSMWKYHKVSKTLWYGHTFALWWCLLMIASSDTSSGSNFLHYNQQSLSKFHFSLDTVDIESPQIGHEWKQFYLVTKTTEFVRLLNIFKKRRRYLHNKNTETHCSSHNFYNFPIVRHKYLMFLEGWNCAANFQNWHFFLKSSLVCRFFGELYWTPSPLELEVLYETS